MTPALKDFPPGTRARFHSQSQGSYLASLGGCGLYVHLNARPYITGVVAFRLPGHMGDYVAFRPDGWPLPDGAEPAGFTAHIGRLELWSGPVTPCVITDGTCHPVSPPDVTRLVDEYLKNT